MIQLEKYRGTKSRHTCPACNNKNQFTRFVDDAGNYIGDDVGICNRASKCGYRYTAKQFFADNPTVSNSKPKARRTGRFDVNASQPATASNVQLERKSFDVIAFESFKTTLGSYDQNNFVQFLFNLFPNALEEIQDILKMYFVGSVADYRGNYTCFPSVDAQNRICRAKLIRFSADTGKRLKGQFDTSSLPAKLKLKEDFQYKQIFFGEHLLSKFPDKAIAVVEAEKTAIIASICFPEFVWLGCNSKSWLKVERLKRLGNRQIILYPDADGYALWQGIAQDAARQGLNVKVSNLIETRATDEQRAGGYDLADYLTRQQSEINQFNDFADSYNAKLESVLNDESLKQDFETILGEQIAIAIESGGLPETEAEKIFTKPENVRDIVTSI